MEAKQEDKIENVEILLVQSNFVDSFILFIDPTRVSVASRLLSMPKLYDFNFAM